MEPPCWCTSKADSFTVVSYILIDYFNKGTGAGGDGKAKRRETTGRSCFQDGGCINGGFYRVRTGHGKPGKSWNLRISFSGLESHGI